MLNEGAVQVVMGADILTTGINRSLFATADDELRPVMNGIYFDITTEDITLVASDGHKLVRNSTWVIFSRLALGLSGASVSSVGCSSGATRSSL